MTLTPVIIKYQSLPFSDSKWDTAKSPKSLAGILQHCILFGTELQLKCWGHHAFLKKQTNKKTVAWWLGGMKMISSVKFDCTNLSVKWKRRREPIKQGYYSVDADQEHQMLLGTRPISLLASEALGKVSKELAFSKYFLSKKAKPCPTNERDQNENLK